MERSNTAREALLAELISDVATLLDRGEKLLLTIDKSGVVLMDATRLLDARVALLERDLTSSVQNSKMAAIQDLKRSTYEFAVASMRRQKEAMTEAVRQVVAEELKLPMQRLAATLQPRVEPTSGRWLAWWTHGATALAAAASTAMLMHAGGG